MVDDESIDFAFSFDSLVHVEEDAMEGYVAELARVLASEGAAVIHHSNKATFPEVENPNHRATSMTAEKFVAYTTADGLRCVGQELLNWGGSPGLIDCISIATRPGSRWDREPVTLEDDGFTEETKRLQCLASVYGARAFSEPSYEWRKAAGSR